MFDHLASRLIDDERCIDSRYEAETLVATGGLG
jgi:hypothetical protein